MSWEIALPDAEGPITATADRRIKPGHEAAFEDFLAGIGGAARAFPGYLGAEVFRPASGERGTYRIIYRFDSPAHLCGPAATAPAAPPGPPGPPDGVG